MNKELTLKVLPQKSVLGESHLPLFAVNDLVMIKNNQVVVSSRQVAEKFGKKHCTVMRDIKKILSQNANLRSEKVHTPKLARNTQVKIQNCILTYFKATTYSSGTGKRYPMYLMNRDGFSLLTMGFTGTKALAWKVAYINAFNEMEKQLKEKQQATAKIPPVQQSLPLNAPEYVRPYECVEYMQRMEEVKGITKAAQVMIDEMECGRKKSELEAAWKVIGDILWKAGYYANSIARVKMPTYPTLE